MKIVALLYLLAGCDYRSFRDCAVACTAQSGCPDGFACGREGFCRAEGATQSCEDVLADAPRMDACVGRQCDVVNCAAQSRPPTTLSGTVFAPNGTLALHGVTVYVPNVDPGALADGVRCDRCEDGLPGEPITRAVTDERGAFKLEDVPAGTNVPVVIQTGKWRRRIVVPTVAECADTPLAASETALPSSRAQGDLPRIAVSTGAADALECLVRRLGVADGEFTTAGGAGRVHLFNGNGASLLPGTVSMALSTTALWDSLDHLKPYDVVVLSCEGTTALTAKPQSAMNAIKQYADLGGRLVMTHSHNIWIGGEIGVPSHAPAEWPEIASFMVDPAPPPASDFTIDTVAPRGGAFASWIVNVSGSTMTGKFRVTNPRLTTAIVDTTRARLWATQPGATPAPSVFQFSTPAEAATDAHCGKVVFADLHGALNSTSTPGTAFPAGCSTAPLTPEEKALAFVLFDASACIADGE
jgi:hypothetical protein